MLIEFSVGNYRSFKDIVTFSMVAANLQAKDKSLDENNVFAADKEIRLLKSSAVYGANASGKSNLIRAIKTMRKFVIESSKETQVTDPISIDPFRLSTETEKMPAHFEMVFIAEGRRYRYGFELTPEQVTAEWLYHVPTIREAKLFERKNGKLEIAPVFKEGKDLKSKTRDNALFLSVVAQFNGEIAKRLLSWFGKLGIISGLEDTIQELLTIRMLQEQETREEIVRFIKSMDVGISDIEVQAQTNLPGQRRFEAVHPALKGVFAEITKLMENPEAKSFEVLTVHKKYARSGEIAGSEPFQIDVNESDGTRKLFAFAGLLFRTLKQGQILCVDELDARLHPLLTQAIIKLFNSNTTNPHNAQLVFATHDTNLLDKGFFRRDQIWFVEKDRFGATQLYSLAEFKVRNDASFGSDYIRGKYGAIPYLGDLSWLAEPMNE